MQQRINQLLSVKGNRGIREIHRELGRIMWDDVGMARTEAEPDDARSQEIPKLRDEFWHNVSVPGDARQPEPEPRVRRPRRRLPRVRRAAGARRAASAANRAAATSARRARRPTARRCATTSTYSYVAAWEFTGVGTAPELHKEPLVFEEVHPTQRSYK